MLCKAIWLHSCHRHFVLSCDNMNTVMTRILCEMLGCLSLSIKPCMCIPRIGRYNSKVIMTEESMLISMVIRLEIELQPYPSFPASLNLNCTLQRLFYKPGLSYPQIDQRSRRITPFFKQDDKGILPSTNLSCSHTQLKCADVLQEEENSLLSKHATSRSETAQRLYKASCII